jgi:AcrR family transcriptional regulator
MPTARADARRNRELVLRTAMRVLSEEGPEVSLGRIAQRAGVGAGTVYRHFPSKQILVEAVLAEHVNAMTAAADHWAARATPGDALFGFLLEAMEKSSGRQNLCDVLTSDKSWPRPVLGPATRRFHRALDRLLSGATQARAVRINLGVEDLSAVILGGAALRSAHQDPARGTSLVRLLLDGLRPTTVTESSSFRDGALQPGHETLHCLECGIRLRVHTTGRPPRYCGPTCRQRAHRRRAAS